MSKANDERFRGEMATLYFRLMNRTCLAKPQNALDQGDRADLHELIGKCGERTPDVLKIGVTNWMTIRRRMADALGTAKEQIPTDPRLGLLLDHLDIVRQLMDELEHRLVRPVETVRKGPEILPPLPELSGPNAPSATPAEV